MPHDEIGNGQLEDDLEHIEVKETRKTESRQDSNTNPIQIKYVFSRQITRLFFDKIYCSLLRMEL